MNTITITSLPPEILIYGGTGQAKVLRPIIEHYGSRVVAVVDDTPGLPPTFPDVPLLFGWDGLLAWLGRRTSKHPLGFCVAIGNPHGAARLRLHDGLETLGLLPTVLVHPMAVVEKSARLEAGCQILAGAVVGVDVILGKEVIINTRASVDHETILEDGVEIAPGATLCGCILVRYCAWIGSGAIVLPRCEIGEHAVVGAGAVVIENVTANSTVVGTPARTIAQRS